MRLPPLLALDGAFLRHLYACVDQEEQWVPVLDAVRSGLGVHSALIQILSTRSAFLKELWTRRDSQTLRYSDIHNRWANTPANPRFRNTAGHLRAPIVTSDVRCFAYRPAERSVLRKGLECSGLGAAFWTSFPINDGTVCTLICHRAPGDERDISEGEDAALQALLPHLTQTMRLRQRIADHAVRLEAIERAGSEMCQAMLVCDRDLKLLWSNARAEGLFARGQYLRLREGRMQAVAATKNQRLRSALDTAACAGEDVFALDCACTLQVRVVPAGAAQGAVPDRFLFLFAEREEADAISATHLARLFGLTQAEARLASDLCSGKSLETIAVKRGVSRNTVRGQLKQILAKTDTSRQADLVRLLLSSVCARVAAN